MKSLSIASRRTLAAIICLVAWITHIASGQLVRQANSTLNLPAELPVATGYTTANAIPFAGGGGMTFTAPMCTAFPPGETNRLFVAERAGQVQLVNNLSGVGSNASKQTPVFMDLAAYLTSLGQSLPATDEYGLLSMAFHLNYSQNGYFYLYFTIVISGQAHQRLARFQSTPVNGSYMNAVSANPNTMMPLLTMRDEAINHNGGDLNFGPDGCLYLSLGDEGGQGDTFNNARFINKDFWGQMLRIAVADFVGGVDVFPAGTIDPNPHTQSNSTSHSSAVHAGTYKIPADNPFIGYTSWHGVTFATSPVSTPVRTEIFATGFRNPFRFSIDAPTGRIFLGDVGQGYSELGASNFSYEEIDQVVKGGDYGWSWREGFHVHNRNWTTPNLPPAYPGPTYPRLEPDPSTGYFNPINPIYEYDRTNDGVGSDAVIYGTSVCGGMVYRGNLLTELSGKYIFAEIFGNNAIVALTETSPGVWSAQRLTTRSQIVDFGADPRDGEPLLCGLGGTIYRLARSGTSGTAPPATLSATGAFSSLANLTPNTGIVPYAPNVNFWSDYAIKSRWFSIKNLTDTINFSSAGNWTFPAGMVWIKHFDIETTRGVPGTRRKLETRFLVKTATDVYGLSYKWRADQSDADLVAEAGLSELIPSSSPSQTWRYPSRGECITCHSQVGGHALSFNAPQMNRAQTFGGVSQNQIQALSNAGYFSALVSGVNNLPAFAPSTDTTQSLEWRVRSYFAVNCVQCHQPGGASQGMWDARSTTATDSANLINGLLINDGGDAANRFAVPGDTTHSMVLKRQQGNGASRMPPLGTNERDLVNEQLVTDWIASLTARQNFTQWLVAQSPSVGTAADDPDRDGRTNHLEYFTRTNPNSASSGWTYGTMQIIGGSYQFQFMQPASRAAIIEASNDLSEWHTWNSPGNQPTYPATDTLRTISAPLNGPDHFFRVRFSEP